MTSPLGEEFRRSPNRELSASRANGSTFFDISDWPRDLVQHSRDLMCIHNLEGRLLAVNPEPARLLGYTVDELLGTPMREFVPSEFRAQFDDYLKKIACDGEAHGLLTVATRSGEKRIWEYRNTLRRSEGAEAVVHGFAQDVTERKRIERELRKSEEQYRSLITAMTEGVALTDADGRFVASNPSAERILGVKPENLSGTPTPMQAWEPYTIHEDGSPFLSEDYPAAVSLRTGEPQENVCMGVQRPTGELRWLLVNSRPLHRGGDSKPYAAVVSFSDITDRTLHGRRLQEYERVLESLDEMIAVVDRDYRYVIANRAFLRYRAVSEDQVLGRPVKEVLDPGVFENIIKGKLDECFSGKVVNYELKYTYPRLGERDLALTYLPVEGPNGVDRVAGVIRDITERKRAEEALAASEGRFRAVFERSPAGICLVDRQTGRFLQTNQQYCDLVGRTEEELKKLDVVSITHPDDQAATRDNVRRLANGESSSYETEKRYLRPDGSICWIHAAGVVLSDASGKTPFGLGIVQDITARKRAAALLEESEKRFRALYEQATVGICLIETATGRFLRANPKYCEIVGRPEQDLLGRDVQSITHPDDVAETAALLRLLEAGTESHFEVEKRYLRPDGSARWVSVHVTSLRATGTSPAMNMAILVDITERKQAEEALRAGEAELRAAQRVGKMGSWYRNLKTENYVWSEQLYRLLGIDPKSPAPSFEECERFYTAESWERIVQATARLIRTGEPDQLEVQFRRVDGTLGWTVLHREADRDETGTIVGTRGIALDITERKRAEEQLRQSEEQIRLFIEHAPASLAMFDRDMRYLEVSRRWRTDLRLGDRDLRGLSFYEVVPEAPDHWKQAHRRALAGEVVRHENDHFQRTDGSTEWVRWEMRPWYEATGNIGGIVIFAENLTEQERAAAALRESEARLRLAQEVAKIGVFERNLQTDEIRWSPEMGALHGLTPAQYPKCLGDLLNLVHPEDRSYLADRIEQSVQTGSTDAEWRVVWPDGSVHWIAGRWNALRDEHGRPVRLLGMDFDITQRKRAEEALRASEAELREAQRVAHMGNWRLDLKTGHLTGSEELDNVLGLADGPESIPFTDLERMVPAESWQRIGEIRQSLVKTGQPEEFEFSFHRPDGSIGWLLARCEVEREANGDPVSLHGIAIDVTDRNRTEEALRRSEESYRNFVAQSSEGIFRQDVDAPIPIDLPEDELVQRILRDSYMAECNEAMVKMYGLTSVQDFLGKRLTEFVDPSDPRNIELTRDYIRSGFRVLERESHETDVQGNPKVFRNSMIGVVENGKLIRTWGIQREVTEQLKLEEARRTAEEALRGSEADLREAQRVARMGSWRLDLRSQILKASEQLFHIVGLERVTSDMPFADLARILPPESWKRVMQSYEKSSQSGQTEELELSFYRCDGTLGWLLVRSKPETDETGALIGLRGIVIETTERKQAEQSLRESEERMRLAQTAARMGSFERNLQTGEGIWAPETERIFGLEPGKGPKSIEAFLTLVHPEDRQQVEHLIAESIESGSVAGEWRVIWPDGSVHWIDGRWKVFKDEQGRPLRMIGIDTDITDRKRAEQVLLESEARERAHAKELEAILDTLPIPVLIAHDAQCSQITGNRAAYQHFRLPPGINLSLSAGQKHELPHHFLRDGSELAREQLPMQVAATTGRPVHSMATKLVFDDGTHRHELGNAAPLFDEHGKVRGAVGAAIDVSDRVHAEDALRRSEERLRVALKNAPITLFHLDRELHYTWVDNLPGGWTEGDFVGKTAEEIFDAAEAAQLRSLTEWVLESGQGRRQELSLSTGGHRSYYDVTVEPLRDSSGRVAGINMAWMDIANLHEITEQLREAKEKLTEEKLYLEQTIDTEMGFEEIIGRSNGLKTVMEQVAKVAATDATVLLLGETGVGKELVARAIHRLSQRKDSSFIKMNCAAIPAGLLESELFGAEKGAYTGSVSRKIGRLELADKGTIFLDEIGEIALELQPKLLRVLQDQEFERLGGTQTLKVDFRLIAATNRDLTEEVRQNQFRSDLYYRLHVFPIRVPPLRERREDIPLLVEHFLRKFAKRMNKRIVSIPRRTMDTLALWDWPGNVRELENFIERSVILTHGSVLAAPLGELQARPSADVTAETLEAAERRHILEALRMSKGRISGIHGAAARLGLKRTTLQSKLKQMNINPRVPPTH